MDGGLVVVNTTSGHTLALDADSGEQKWDFESEVPPLSLRGVSSPVMASGGVLTGTANGKLAVVVAENGVLAWEQAVASPTGATELDRIADIDTKPLIIGGSVYVVSYDGTLAALDLRSGRIMWKREYASFQSLSYAGNNLFVVDTSSVVYALDRRNGIELWSQSGLRERGLTAAQTVADYVVVGDKWGFVHWLNQTDGKIVARLSLGGDDEDEGIYTAPVVDGNVFYTQTRDGQVYAVETP
ncbi:PQQ-binding-like beta-propeller repeat protein [Pseudobowmanella zhangzhouensis]